VVWGGRINDRLVNVLPSVRSTKNLMPHRAMVTVARAQCWTCVRCRKYCRNSSSVTGRGFVEVLRELVDGVNVGLLGPR
jgi:hypothetical protein